MFSNSARAHQQGKTLDWVVIVFERDGQEEQCTVVTEYGGELAGRRVIRGRETECAEHCRRQQAQREIERLHRFFEDWFSGELPDDGAVFATVESALSPNFNLVSPGGRSLPRAVLLSQIRAAHGSRRGGLRIWIDDLHLHYQARGILICGYREWQRQGSDAARGRNSTAVFEDHGDKLLWLHVHETWLPPRALPTGGRHERGPAGRPRRRAVVACSPRGASLTRQDGEFPQSPATEEILDLRVGQPAPSLLPLDLIEAAARDRLCPGRDPLVLQYGVAQGYLGFREALAAFLREQTGDDVRPETLAATAGISSALGMCAQVFARPGARVACGDPTYFLARHILETAHLRPVGIPVDSRGMDVEALKVALDRGLEIAFVYVIPSFHNPCAVNLDPARAERLIELAVEHDFLIVADEPYPMLHFEPAFRPPTMMSYDRGRARVVSLGSFSKILSPGLRLGWLHAEPPLVERFLEHGVLRSGGALNPVVSSLVHGAMQSGALAEHLSRLRRELGRRARALTRALEHHLPELDTSCPEGGYFLWGELPGGIDTTELLEHARAHHGVGFAPGARCAIDRDLSSSLRLSFSFYEEAELEEAAARLAAAVRVAVV